MAITSKKNTITGYDAAYAAQQKRTYQESLEDLRDDDEFVKTTERFLKSTNAGDSVADLYQYFRGADWNVRDATAMALDIPNFTEEQKKDFNYLRNRFNRARVGGAREKYQLTVDATQELLSDPLNWASVLLIPWTGTTSLGARLVGGEAAKQALKQATKKLTVRQHLAKTYLSAPGQLLKSPLSTKQILKIASAEGFLYGGTHNYVYQSIDLAAGQRTQRNYLETATAGAIGAVAAPAIIGSLRGLGGLPKYINSVNEQRIAKIDHNENYKSTWFEGKVGTLVEGVKYTSDALKLTALPLRPTTFLRKKAKDNILMQNLLKLFRYDALEGFFAPALGKQRLLRADYNRQLGEFWGRKSEKLNKILGSKGWNLRTHQNRFTSKYKRNWVMNPGLSDSVNNDLAYFLRSGKSFKIIKGKKVKLADNIIGAGKEIRKELDDIYNKAVKAGLKPNRALNYFPRWWRIDAIKNNKTEFINKIMRAEKLSKAKATDLWKKLVTEGNPESSTTGGLSSRLLNQRILNKLDDAEFGKFLNNDVEGVLKQYYAEASGLITRTKLFGETTEDFVKRWINPIKKSGLDLTKIEEIYLKTLYEVVTGQRGRFNRNKRMMFDLIPIGKIGAGVHDLFTVTMQTSMLGLATLTSFAEIGIPLLLGTEAKIGGKAIMRAVSDSGKEWWGKQKQNFGVGDPNIDIRPMNRQDLNAFMTSVNLAGEDRAVAIYGQAMGKTATKIQNFFFKTIGLHDWTRFVQLVGYDTGKNIIGKNLKIIADNPTAKGSAKKSDAYILRLKDELEELGINTTSGLNWLKRGGLHTDRFYIQDVRGGAVRYTNEVVMNPTAASAQKPLVHSLAISKAVYGLMGFPTAFANGPLRRVIRNMTKDAHTISSGGARISTPRAITGAIFMAHVGLLNYTLRTRGQNFEDLESGKITEYELWERSLMYAGLLGPGEYYVRYYRAEQYESKISAAISSVIGPNLPDLIEYTTKFWEKGVLRETALKRAPFSVALKSLHREKYNEWLKWAREKDRESWLASSGPDEKEKVGKSLYREDELSPLATGGLVEGEDNVPYTKENPADRINPYTGEPYQEQMDRLGFNIGGILARQLFKPKLSSKELVKKLSPTKTVDEAVDLSLKGKERKEAINKYRELQKIRNENYDTTSKTQFFSDVEMYELIQLNSQLADAIYKIDAGRNFKLPSDGSKLSYGKDFTVLKSDSIIPTAATDMYRNKNIFNTLYQHAAGHSQGGKQYTAVDNILMGKNPDISPLEFYNNFSKTREELKKAYGDTITLYRLERSTNLIDELGEKPITNWMHKGKLFEMLKEEPAYKNAKEIKKDIKVDDVVAINLGGTYGEYNEFLVKSDLFSLARLKELSTTENRFNFERGGKVSANEQMDRLGFASGTQKFDLKSSYRDPKTSKLMFLDSEGNPVSVVSYMKHLSKLSSIPTTKTNSKIYDGLFGDEGGDQEETGTGVTGTGIITVDNIDSLDLTTEVNLDKWSTRPIIRKLIMTESGGKEDADSGHAKGLMQIKDSTADKPGINFADGTPVQPARREGPNGEISSKENVRFGTDYFDALTDRYGGDLVTAAMAYNAGMGTIDNWIASGRKYEELSEETQDYIGKIFGKDIQEQVKTGTYYSLPEDRLGFNIGGVLARQLIKRSLPASKPVQQKILKDTSDISKAGIQDKDLLTEYKKNLDDIWEFEQKWQQEGHKPKLFDEGDKLMERQDALTKEMKKVGYFYEKEYTTAGEYKLVMKREWEDPNYTSSEDVVYRLDPTKYNQAEAENQIIKLLDENLLIKDDQDIGIKTLIKVASNNSPRDATILKTLDKNDMLWIDSPGGYYKEKLYEAAETLYAKGHTLPTKSGKNMLPFERLAIRDIGNRTFQVGTGSKPFFVNPNKLDNLINFSSSGRDYFRYKLSLKNPVFENRTTGREYFLNQINALKNKIAKEGYFGKGTNSYPIQIEVSRFGDVYIPEGNHRLALALISKQEEVPIVLTYYQGAERLKTNLSIDNLSSLLDKGKTGYKTNKEFGILKRKVNKQFKNVEDYTDEYVKKQGYSLGGKVSANEQMDRLGL